MYEFYDSKIYQGQVSLRCTEVVHFSEGPLLEVLLYSFDGKQIEEGTFWCQRGRHYPCSLAMWKEASADKQSYNNNIPNLVVHCTCMPLIVTGNSPCAQMAADNSPHAQMAATTT